jgi:hypothetical protein
MARWTPETAVAGTRQDAETAQLPQSTRPVDVSRCGAGWFPAFDPGVSVGEETGAVAPVPAEPVDPDPPLGGDRPHLELDGPTGIHAEIGSEALDGVIYLASGEVPLDFRSAGCIPLTPSARHRR